MSTIVKITRAIKDTEKLIKIISKKGATIFDANVRRVAEKWTEDYQREILGIVESNQDAEQNFNILLKSLNNDRLIKIKWLKSLRLIKKRLNDFQFNSKKMKLLKQNKPLLHPLNNKNTGKIVIVPKTVLELLDADIVKHCDELNDNLRAENWISSMLLMRKILPLAIIRKFQKDKRKSEVVDSSGEYLSTEKLLTRVQDLIQPRIYNELKQFKFLYDGIQHFFNFIPQDTDISPATIRLRVFLEDLFKKKIN